MSKTLPSAVKDVVVRMLSSHVTGNEAWSAEVRAASDGTLLAWSRDALLLEPGCGYIGDHIAAEMARRVAAAPPRKVAIIDYGPKR